MTTWSDVTTAAPELAAAVQQRFEQHGLGLMATLRRDGSPRITGIEPLFALGELWLGMMEGARKSADLRRDPRLALHAATVDKQVADGDAKVSGRAELVGPGALFDAYVEEFRAATGDAPPPPFDLFRVDVGEIGRLQPAGDHLVIEWWRPDCGYRRIERR